MEVGRSAQAKLPHTTSEQHFKKPDFRSPQVIDLIFYVGLPIDSSFFARIVSMPSNYRHYLAIMHADWALCSAILALTYHRPDLPR
jgi:hypothetical protein